MLRAGAKLGELRTIAHDSEVSEEVDGEDGEEEGTGRKQRRSSPSGAILCPATLHCRPQSQTSIQIL